MADIQQSDAQLNGVVQATVPVVSSEAVGSKRQRRPSVRLGDIGGDQSYESHLRRPSSSSAASKQWKHQPHLSYVACFGSKSSKTRAITNPNNNETFDDEREANKDNNNLDGVAIGSWRVKDFKKRAPATKRIRSNWVPKFDDSSGGGNNVNINGNNNETGEKYSGGEDNDGFDMENSESPIKEQSPIHCLDNLGIHGNETEVVYHRNDNRRPLTGPSENGITIWLNGLGLERYAPLFEIHEVDDEVLPLLTLEDLKDMGINAVGSRRKIFCAIQKLSKGFL